MRRAVYTNERHPWASKPLRGPAAGENRCYRSSTAMIWTKLRIYERTGRLHTQAWCANGCRPQWRDCGGRAAAKVYGRVKAGNIAASCASRRYRPSPPRAAAFAGRRRAQTVGCARRYTGRRSAVNGGARVCMRSLFLHSVIASISLGAGVRTCGYARRRTFSAVRRGFAVRHPLLCAGKAGESLQFH